MWFREDLRLADNPALTAAVEAGDKIICLFIQETGVDGARALGGAAKWWLHKSLAALAERIEERGGVLTLRRGDPRKIILALATETGAAAVFWNRRYDANGIETDKDIKASLKEAGIKAESHNGRLLTEPWEIQTNTGSYYKVFTPYWKAVRRSYDAPEALAKPERLDGPQPATDALEDWQLLPTEPDWAAAFPDHWTPGEAGATARLEAWLSGPINRYDDDRNRPDLKDSTSGLSPHLRWGEVSPVRIWRAVKAIMETPDSGDEGAAETFLSEIVWREFSYVLLFHQPQLASENYNKDFRHMPWRSSGDDYDRWCKGQTGYPIVDAGMRQLWAMGWMHNRVRMITGSFLTKHLLLPWQEGEAWFWDTLVDADPASNAASWQWVAGSGADAAPYFRVFNPITQGSKFDETGAYVREWCPELAKLPDKFLHSPWEAPTAILKNAGVELGQTYPHPMVEHKAGRQRALDAYDVLKERRSA